MISPHHSTSHPSKHVLFVISSLALGGAESQLVLLAERLKARNWRVEVFALDAVGELAPRLDKANIPIRDGGYRHGPGSKLSKFSRLTFATILLSKHILVERPRIVHGFLPLTNFLTAVTARLGLTPMVVTSKRGLGLHQERHPWLGKVDRIANALSHQITANASEVAADTERRDGYPASRIAVIPNGLNFARFESGTTQRAAMRRELGLRDDEIGIVKVANLIPYKGHADLLQAFSALQTVVPNAHLFLVGEDRGIATELRTIVGSAAVAERVHFLGRRIDVPEILCAMDVGVMASHEEGLSNALIEKLAAGLRVVATDVGGNAEILADMPNCRLVPPKNPAAMADALQNVIRTEFSDSDNATVRQQLVQQRYSVEAMVDAYESLYLG